MQYLPFTVPVSVSRWKRSPRQLVRDLQRVRACTPVAKVPSDDIYAHVSQWLLQGVNTLFAEGGWLAPNGLDSWNGLAFSSAFAGLSAERFVLTAMTPLLQPFSTHPWHLRHACCFEIDAHAIDVLRATTGAALFGNISSLLDDETLSWALRAPRDFGLLKQRIWRRSRIKIASELRRVVCVSHTLT